MAVLFLNRHAENPYDRGFFEGISAGSASSAAEVIPEVMRLISPRSVVDVGCGTGEWLGEVRKVGIDDVVGVDGDYVDRKMLKIPPALFLARDLRNPLELDRAFDLAISVEVGEHLPPERAESFVADLTKLAPVVLFSAAIPFQHGTDHINERWPDYWADLFARRDYVALDCLRPRFWNDQRIDWWYRQNMILYVRRAQLSTNPELQRLAAMQPLTVLRLVHPERYLQDQARGSARLFR